MALRSYLRRLLNSNELKAIITEVDCDLEIAEICRNEFSSAGGGKALIFEAVKGTPVRVGANLFGSKERLLRMLEVDEAGLITLIRTLIHSGADNAATNLTNACRLSSIEYTAPEYQYQELTLKEIPALRSWPQENDRYLSLALTHSVSPANGVSNLGLYRAAVVGDREIALNFAPGSGADNHLQIAEARGEPLPVALLLGADPALFWSAAAPLPTGCNEYGFTGAITGRPVTLSSCLTQPLSVPANAEILIEGEIRPGERVSEGPFGNHTGQYVSRADCPLMRITAIRHRIQPIIPVTVVGPPPSENIYLAKLNELLLREMLTFDFPQIADLVMPEMTAFHGVAVIALRQCSAADVADLIKQLRQSTCLGRSRLLVLVDDDINIQNLDLSWWRAVNLASPECVIATDKGLIINATGINRKRLVIADQATTALVNSRHYQISSEIPENL